MAASSSDEDVEEVAGGILSRQLFPRKKNFSDMKLKPDHANRPIWTCRDNRIFLETYSSHYKEAYDFLIAIADPVSRPKHIHEYIISRSSLYAAASLGLDAEEILSALDRLSKTQLPSRLKDYVIKITSRCGKLRMVLRAGRYFVESQDKKVLQAVLERSPVIRQARLAAEAARSSSSSATATQQTEPKLATDVETGFFVMGQSEEETPLQLGTGSEMKELDQRKAMGLSQRQKKVLVKKILGFEIDWEKVEEVKNVCSKELNYPMLEEYDFKKDQNSPSLPVELRASTSIRDYQHKSLSKMFGNGRARSGIIVLPCGAGKTLVGITAMTTIRKSTLIFCTTGVAVNQWKNQIKKWTTLEDKYINCLTSQNQKPLTRHGDYGLVVITTYSMVAVTRQRSVKSEAAMKLLRELEWGLVLMDEVHVAPAAKFKHCVTHTKSRCKLGLTATLVREDQRLGSLEDLIGPKLYEANWLTLQEKGYIATVDCFEVWCPMPAEFYQEYLRAKREMQRLIYVGNPNKFRACEFLIQQHIENGDKVLVFSDIIWGLDLYADKLGYPKIHGQTSIAERVQVLNMFKDSSDVNCLFISKIGDNSIDLPEVNVIIQISSLWGSRRQEAQRLGRILRPKQGRQKAYFYTLISRDTLEMRDAIKRQRFLVDQGYAYETISELAALNHACRCSRPHACEKLHLHYTQKSEQQILLSEILASSEEDAKDEVLSDDAYEEFTRERKRLAKARRQKGSLSALSTGVSSRTSKKKERRKPKRHKLFQAHERQMKKRKEAEQRNDI